MKDIALRWVKGHADHIGNEEADTLAKQGAMDENLMITDIPLPSHKLLKIDLENALFKASRWIGNGTSPAGKQNTFFPEINQR